MAFKPETRIFFSGALVGTLATIIISSTIKSNPHAFESTLVNSVGAGMTGQKYDTSGQQILTLHHPTNGELKVAIDSARYGTGYAPNSAPPVVDAATLCAAALASNADVSTETEKAWNEGQKESDQESNAAAAKYYRAANGCRIALVQVDIAEIPIGPKINS